MRDVWLCSGLGMPDVNKIMDSCFKGTACKNFFHSDKISKKWIFINKKQKFKWPTNKESIVTKISIIW